MTVKCSGVFKWVKRDVDGTVLDSGEFPNGWTTSGINNMLSVYFNSGTQITTWYVGLVNNSGFSAFAASDTISSHGGWTEITSTYSESVRQTWDPATPASGTIGSDASMTFTATGSGFSAKGAFVVSNSTKGGTTGQLFSTGAFGSVQTLTAGQTLSITYSGTITPT